MLGGNSTWPNLAQQTFRDGEMTIRDYKGPESVKKMFDDARKHINRKIETFLKKLTPEEERALEAQLKAERESKP